MGEGFARKKGRVIFEFRFTIWGRGNIEFRTRNIEYRTRNIECRISKSHAIPIIENECARYPPNLKLLGQLPLPYGRGSVLRKHKYFL